MAKIRKFQEGDEGRMREIAPRAFSVWTRLALDKTLSREANEEYFRREVTRYINNARRKNGDLSILVTEEDGNAVGYIVVWIDRERSAVFGFSWGIIISLAVDPDYHGRGIGSSLIAAGLDWLKEKGAKYVEVLTDQNNIAAIRAYEKNGFRVIYSSIVLSQYL
jgi:ribosomal protein S18 acetylase RimI-like enzyme